MAQNYLKIYQIALDLQDVLSSAKLQGNSSLYEHEEAEYEKLIRKIAKICDEYEMPFTHDMAVRALERPIPKHHTGVLLQLAHLNDAFCHELEREEVFRIPPSRKEYFEHDHLFGKKVAAAFPSCERDIRKAGSCYALGQEDACVHHLMLVLERGLIALAAKVEVPFARLNWQNIIEPVLKKVKTLPPSKDKDFYLEVNAQFGFLKDAYRNHAEHVRDDPFDLERALSILNHVRAFMKALESGGLSE